MAFRCGHAIQDDTDYKPLVKRSRMVGMTRSAEKLGATILMAAPVLAFITRRPTPTLILFLAGLASMGAPVLAHLATLPVEFDASFNRALPLLRANGHLKKEHNGAARQLLRAAAFTYVAASLNSLLNFWKWFRMMRR